MNRRSLLAGFVGTAALPGLAVAQTREITVFKGVVTNANFKDVLGLIADSTDKIVGLKLHFDRPLREPFVADYHEGSGRFTDGEEIELNFDAGAGWHHGMIVFDGFFLIKYGSMNQGILFFHGKEVSEEMILMNPALNLIERSV